MPSDGLFTGAADRSRWRAARATRRRQEPLRTKTKLAPARGTNRVASAGPTMPEILNCKPLKVAADGSSESETTWGTIAVQAGGLKAHPAAMMNTLSGMKQGLSKWSQPSNSHAIAVIADA